MTKAGNNSVSFALLLFGLVAAMVISTVVFSGVAYASIQGTIDNCKNYEVNNRILGPVVQCMTDVMKAVTQQYIQDVVVLLRDSVITVMAIAVALLGARVALGASNRPYKDVSILILKITLISYFVLNSGVNEYLTLLTDFTAGITDLLIGVLKDNQVFSITKDVVDPQAQGAAVAVTVQPPGGQKLWFQIDFVLQRLLGLGGGDTNMLQGMIGIAMILTGLFSMGPVGGWLGVLVMFTLGTVFAAFVMAIFTYIASLIAIMALGAFSPIVIPMILFQQTRVMFDKWVTQLLSYALQPLILTAFLIFMVEAMEHAVVDMITLYQDGYETATGAEGRNAVPLFPNQDTQKRTSTPGVKDQESYKDFVYRFVAGVGWVPELQVSKTKGIGGNDGPQVPVLAKDKKFVQEFAMNILLSLFLGYIMLIFIYELPKLVNDLIGDRTVPDLIGRFGKPAFDTIMKTEGAMVGHLTRFGR